MSLRVRGDVIRWSARHRLAFAGKTTPN